MCLLDGAPVEVQALRWAAHQQLVLGSFCCCCGLSTLSNIDPPDHGTVVTNHRLQRLFFCGGGEGGLDRKPVTPSVDLHGRPPIGRTTMLSEWLPCWRHQICVKIRWRQRGCSENYRID